jgi:hypothetical protein
MDYENEVKINISGTYFFYADYLVSTFYLDIQNLNDKPAELKINNAKLKSKFFNYKLSKNYNDFENKKFIIESKNSKSINIYFGTTLSEKYLDNEFYKKRDDSVNLELEIDLNNSVSHLVSIFNMK